MDHLPFFIFLLLCRKFVEENLGTKYVEPVRLDFDKLYEDSGPSTPMFFILSPGVHPLQDVEKLGTTLCLLLAYLVSFPLV